MGDHKIIRIHPSFRADDKRHMAALSIIRAHGRQADFIADAVLAYADAGSYATGNDDKNNSEDINDIYADMVQAILADPVLVATLRDGILHDSAASSVSSTVTDSAPIPTPPPTPEPESAPVEEKPKEDASMIDADLMAGLSAFTV